jgi:hypothetical protein
MTTHYEDLVRRLEDIKRQILELQPSRAGEP